MKTTNVLLASTAVLTFGLYIHDVMAPNPVPRGPVAVVPVQRPPELTPQEKLLAEQTPAQDAEREKIIANAQETGLFGTVDYAARELTVGPGFYAQDFKFKQAMAFVVVLNGMRKANTTAWDLHLVDSKSGKRVGTYSTLWWRLEME